MGDKAGASAVERAFADYLGSLADRADGLRVEARSTLERGVRQAHDMGWSQRRIAASLGRSQPEVRRLLHRGLEGDPDAVRARAEAVARESVLDDVLRRRRDEIVAVAERYGARRWSAVLAAGGPAQRPPGAAPAGAAVRPATAAVSGG